jgi:DegV family protein with EDD domain
MTSIAIIVDAACDLPASFIQQHNVFVMPFNVVTDSACVKDDGLPQTKLRLYKSHIINKTLDFARTDILLPNEIESFFFEHIVFNYDSAVFITVSASRSEMFSTMQSTWKHMSIKCFQLRREKGLQANFNLEIIDSGTMGPGQGLLAYAAVAAVKTGGSITDVVHFVQKIRGTIYIYGVASDLLYAYTRAKAKNENSITWGKYALASTLNLKPILRFHDGDSTTVGRGRGFDGAFKQITSHLRKKLAQGLRVNRINVSYSGDLVDIEQSSDYIDLITSAKKCGVAILLSNMSVTLAVHIGEKAIMVAFCAESSDFSL